MYKLIYCRSALDIMDFEPFTRTPRTYQPDTLEDIAIKAYFERLEKSCLSYVALCREQTLATKSLANKILETLKEELHHSLWGVASQNLRENMVKKLSHWVHRSEDNKLFLKTHLGPKKFMKLKRCYQFSSSDKRMVGCI